MLSYLRKYESSTDRIWTELLRDFKFDNPASRNLSFLSTRSIGILNFRIPNKEGHKLPLPSALSATTRTVPNQHNFLIWIISNSKFFIENSLRLFFWSARTQERLPETDTYVIFFENDQQITPRAKVQKSNVGLHIFCFLQSVNGFQNRVIWTFGGRKRSSL